ncbi:hypothetical protein BMS3Abin01_01414 [bacterium BMS3Abin01]|nr:hypothetical protein BMS3Abin01_01414 [bacterium BMS3Abin01]
MHTRSRLPAPAVITRAMRIAALLAVVLAAGLSAGCGGGDVPGAATDVMATTPASPDAGAYASDVSDLADHADQVNRDYSRQVDRQQAGVIDTATLIADADDGVREFTVMVGTLEGMEPPQGLAEAHRQLISAFGKWLQFYRLQVSGLRNDDAGQLAQAHELDSQAVSEASQAINSINGRPDR